MGAQCCASEEPITEKPQQKKQNLGEVLLKARKELHQKEKEEEWKKIQFKTHPELRTLELEAREAGLKYIEENLDNGAVYRGYVKDQKRHGPGIFTWMDKAKYEGMWSDGLREGQGKITLSDGSIYEGEWKKDTQEGYGIMYYSNGSKYVGMWINGMQHGRGTYTTEEQTEVEQNWNQGQWVRGLASFGIKTLPVVSDKATDNQQVYGQQFGDNEYLCLLEEIALRDFAICEERYFPNQSRHKGYHENDERNGPGIYIWADGARYEGDWFQDKMNGKGRLKNEKGEKFEGMWTNNELVFQLRNEQKKLEEQTLRLILAKGVQAMFKKKKQPDA